MGSLLGSQKDPPAVYPKFDSYPWASDREFMFGATAMRSSANLNTPDLEDGASPSATSIDLMVRSRIWFFNRRFGTDIDFSAYKQWLTSHPDHRAPDAVVVDKVNKVLRRLRQQQQINGGATTAIPSWQAAAPKADLQIKHDAPADDAAADGSDAPYPERFAHIVEAVTTGKPVPGIRDIPNKVVRKPGITAFGTMQAPRKPWEKMASPGAASPGGGGKKNALVDEQFPDVDPADGDHQFDGAEEDAMMREG